MAQEFRFKVAAPKQVVDGWRIKVLNRRTGKWEEVRRYVGGLYCTFESKAHAVRYAGRYADHPDYLGEKAA